MFHGGSGEASGLAQTARHRNGGDAIDRGVLDSAVRHSFPARDPSDAGQCARHQEHAGTENGRAGMPVAVEAARVWIVEEFVPAGRADPGDADFVASAAAAHSRRLAYASAYAEGAHADE